MSFDYMSGASVESFLVYSCKASCRKEVHAHKGTGMLLSGGVLLGLIAPCLADGVSGPCGRPPTGDRAQSYCHLAADMIIVSSGALCVTFMHSLQRKCC